MTPGFFALLDEIAAIAKMAAASLDDSLSQAARVGAKSLGVAVDDAAVTPRYAVGFAAARELPIVAKIALGSLKNKFLFLLPAALLLSAFAPWLITPLLMGGGAFLCFEGFEKIWHALRPHHEETTETVAVPTDSSSLETAKVKGAVRTDLILSGEIMAIALSTLAEETSSVWDQALVLAIVGFAITVLVYGVVALIVKADDVGLAMAQNPRPLATCFRLKKYKPGTAPTGLDRAVGPFLQGIGKGLVRGMPGFLSLLTIVGTAAMLWVGGGILIHGMVVYGITFVEHPIHAAAVTLAAVVPDALNAVVAWSVTAFGAGVFGVLAGGVIAAVVLGGQKIFRR